ncbi:MAG: AmmeMemoRadiSam system protein B [Spirochaetia bacterium]|nr:AmmeMemoRadiSam system protein B [Spirochaetia bacterium]
METVRESAVAGSFYPDEKKHLADLVDSYLSGEDKKNPLPEAIIVPHAGYMYSGAVAGKGYTSIKQLDIKNILIIGPAHRVYVNGLAIPDCDAFVTPLGKISVNKELYPELVKLPFISINDEAHKDEHCIEVQLPFLQRLFTSFQIIPVLAGNADEEQIQTLFDLTSGKIDLIIVSSDLSHYNSYETAKNLDRNAANSIEALDPFSLESEQACGSRPIKGLLLYAKRAGLKVKTLVLQNSGDVSGSRSSVVGYGSFIFYKHS